MLYGEDPIFDPSLHVLRAPCSALWVVDCGSLVTPFLLHMHGSALDVMDYGLAKAKEFSNELIARMLLILRIIALGLLLQ